MPTPREEAARWLQSMFTRSELNRHCRYLHDFPKGQQIPANSNATDDEWYGQVADLLAPRWHIFLEVLLKERPSREKDHRPLLEAFRAMLPNEHDGSPTISRMAMLRDEEPEPGHATEIKAALDAVWKKMDCSRIHPGDRFNLALDALQKLFPHERLYEHILESPTIDIDGEDWEGPPEELQ